jgi:hypothetical protein
MHGDKLQGIHNALEGRCQILRKDKSSKEGNKMKKNLETNINKEKM